MCLVFVFVTSDAEDGVHLSPKITIIDSYKDSPAILSSVCLSIHTVASTPFLQSWAPGDLQCAPIQPHHHRCVTMDILTDLCDGFPGIHTRSRIVDCSACMCEV